MKTIKIPFGGKGYKVDYKVETINLSVPSVDFLNVYSVFIEDPELQKIVGDHFTVLFNQLLNPKPFYDIKSSGNLDEVNLKRTIVQQIMNNPTE
ncbi:MAG TPA: hypothetical protein VM888_02045 [Chitinophagaceae bacterium]|jgi:hypothetical protein|nr:hypothetical protein [Chitinophagaceae bacterium]